MATLVNFLPHDRDAALIGRFMQGDPDAFDALVARHRARVHGLAYQMTRDREMAEDITVEVFCETFRALPRYRPEAKFSTWLHRIVVNVTLEHLRQVKRRRQLEEVLLEDDLPARDNTAETAITRELTRSILQAIQDLPQIQQESIRRFYFEQQSCAEIAQALQIPRNTVKTRIFHGIHTLRDRLQAEATLQSKGVPHGEM